MTVSYFANIFPQSLFCMIIIIIIIITATSVILNIR